MDIWVQIIGVDMTPEISFLLDGATTVVILYNHQVNNIISNNDNNNNNNNNSYMQCFAFHSFKGRARFPALSFGRAFFIFPPFSLAAHYFPRSCFDCFFFGWISFLKSGYLVVFPYLQAPWSLHDISSSYSSIYFLRSALRQLHVPPLSTVFLVLWLFHSSGLRFILSRAFSCLLSLLACYIPVPALFNFYTLSTVGIVCFPASSWYAVLLSCSPALFRVHFPGPFHENYVFHC